MHVHGLYSDCVTRSVTVEKATGKQLQDAVDRTDQARAQQVLLTPRSTSSPMHQKHRQYPESNKASKKLAAVLIVCFRWFLVKLNSFEKCHNLMWNGTPVIKHTGDGSGLIQTPGPDAIALAIRDSSHSLNGCRVGNFPT
jgi:hypothetical protein